MGVVADRTMTRGCAGGHTMAGRKATSERAGGRGGLTESVGAGTVGHGGDTRVALARMGREEVEED
jgi:hypothetical protein